ncbi:MAG TPA: RluA family pseudouridine synthase [Holophagaceae bacterium]
MTQPAAPNGGCLHRERIARADAGATVLAHLAARHPRAAELEWARRIAEGEVQVDGLPAAPGQRLEAGQELVWSRPPWVEPEAPLATAVLYEDEDLLALAKPSGLPTMPGGGEFQEHTLLALVRRRWPEASPMHRLGRGTSGVVLFARTAEAGRRVQADFREHRLRKVYRTLCTGQPDLDAFDIAAPIGKVPHPLLGTVHGANPGGRASFSRVRVLERREEGALVEVEIETGRPHQIRIHLAFAGHPLVGDPLYGPGGIPLPGTTALPGDLGYRLHALRLELLHPRTGRPLAILCAPPAVLRRGQGGPDF